MSKRELEKALLVAQGAKTAMRTRIAAYKEGQIELRVKPLEVRAYEERSSINSEVDELFSSDYQRLIEEERAAQDALDDFNSAAARENTGWHPVGTKVFEWRIPRHSYGRGEKRKTGLVGIVRVWDRESKSGGASEYRLPKCGDTYVRLLKKDGTEGAKFARLSFSEYYDEREHWLPEGVEPKQPKGRS